MTQTIAPARALAAYRAQTEMHGHRMEAEREWSQHKRDMRTADVPQRRRSDGDHGLIGDLCAWIAAALPWRALALIFGATACTTWIAVVVLPMIWEWTP